MAEPAPVLAPRATSTRTPLVAFAVLLVVAVVFLRWQGRVWWCALGDLAIVSLDVNSPHNSQHPFDPYLLSHVLHGVLFFGLTWLFSDRFNLPWRFLLSAIVEVVWEMVENSPLVIDRYRNATVSLGYTGDSIANSLGDVASFAGGFFLARAIGLWGSVALCVVIEVGMVLWIKDNLTLNVLMLLLPAHSPPSEAIRRWQSGG